MTKKILTAREEYYLGIIRELRDLSVKNPEDILDNGQTVYERNQVLLCRLISYFTDIMHSDCQMILNNKED